MVNMLRHYRNNPSVVMWSIGNEVPTQCSPDGASVARFLTDICHREDPTRPVTCGMDQVSCVLENGFAEVVDIPGLNYRTFRYLEAHEKLPQELILGSETGSTVSSRGVYKFPAVKRFSATDADHQCSAYELDACSWSNIPDIDFALADDYPWTLGQFVWTGFDYLGEPSPYDTDAWPNHSSMFGIIDLASLPKDRYWLFRSVWNRESPTLHLLPHWNWQEGDRVPVMAFTSYDMAELFLNGVSLGVRRKEKATSPTLGGQEEALEGRYRLIWEDVPFEPGELKVVAYSGGQPVMEKAVHTAGEPHHIVLEPFTDAIKADGKDLAYVTVAVVDKDGNPCPLDGSLLTFKVSGAGTFRAAANGDPTCLDIFHEPRMHAFGGKLTVIVQAGNRPGKAVLEVSGEGLQKGKTVIKVKP
jgi:beta-galactosidase